MNTAVAIFAVALVTGNPTPVNVTVFGVSMGSNNSNSVTIWQNDKQTNQTFFMDGTLNNTVVLVGRLIHNDFGQGFPFPFLNNFTINRRLYFW